jgi:hypothetical protein
MREEYFRQYRLKNKDKINQKSREYYHSEGRYLNAFNARRTIQSRFRMGISNAKRKDIEWSISLDEYKEIMSKDICTYCQGPLEKAGNCLDRKDSKIGYKIDNVVTCCKNCNYLKGSQLSFEEMLEMIILLKQLRKTENIWLNNK